MNAEARSPLVSIGLPVYDRPELLRLALASLTAQSYRNIEVIVSDDCSPGDGTRRVVEEYAARDRRIRYSRRRSNIGAQANNFFVFENATGEFFQWASEDDEWDPRFIETGVRALRDNPDRSAWMSTIVNTDEGGRLVREYDGFSRFTSTSSKRNDIRAYLLEPEVLGKANLIHGIFRRQALGRTIEAYRFNRVWGTDMCFMLAFLARFDLLATDEVLMRKRIRRPAAKNDMVLIEDPSRHIFPLAQSVAYVRENLKAAANTEYRGLVLRVMLRRLPIAIRNSLSDRLSAARRAASRLFAGSAAASDPDRGSESGRHGHQT
jgi:glycosyltransferase involved in cell wall biosynthesis